MESLSRLCYGREMTIIRSVDYYLEPLQVAYHLASRPDFVFLDSSDHDHKHARYSIIAIEPFLKFSHHRGQNHISLLNYIPQEPKGLLSSGQKDSAAKPLLLDEPLLLELISQLAHKQNDDPFDTLRHLLSRFRLADCFDFPFPLGASIGYISYDLGASREAGLSCLKGLEDWPHMEWRLYDTLLIFDHRKRIITLVSTGFPFTEAQKQDQWAQRRFSHLLSVLEKIRAKETDQKEKWADADALVPSCSWWRVPSCSWWRNEQQMLDLVIDSTLTKAPLRSNFTATSYQDAVRVIKEYISQGDVYQVNLSQQFTSQTKEAGFDLYCKIRQINPVPYGAYVRFDQREILCFSMECFLRMEGRKVQTRPIKGTIPRGKTPREDFIRLKQLWQSEKDRAELLMVVDMERNDLGKVCEFNTVRVDRLFEVEKYATVFHLVSTVSGQLRPEFDHLDCLLACFPGGSITGTPKIRAMQIIAELEKIRRGVYCGALGYFGFNQISDFNIPIRTILKQGEQLWFSAGGGVVADSDPYLEYLETLHKVRAFLACFSTDPVPSG